ncbi:MAG: DNA topoisomerase subunit B [bacterium]
MAKEEKKVKYGADQITVLEGLEAVRRRPGMYIGTTGPDGLHHLVWEIFDNSRDEAMANRCSRIEVALLPDGYVRITDDGAGIPVDMHSKTKVSALETIMTVLHAGGKFDNNSYKFSGGLHGVGASVVNALSIHLKAEVHRDGGKYLQEYKIGKPLAKVKKVANSKEHGTITTFKPDIEIFKEGIDFNYEKIVSHLRQQAYLVKNLLINVIDAREYKEKINFDDVFFLKDENIEAPSVSFYFEGGLVSLIKFYNTLSKPIHKNIFYVEKEEGKTLVEVAVQYIDDMTAKIVGFANNIYNPEGGTHITGFKTALTRTINTYAKKNGYVKEADESFIGDDVLEGITAVVSVKLPEIQFEGQTKAKLGSMEAQGAVASVLGESFAMYLEENPEDAKAIMNKVILAMRGRKAAKAAKDSILRKGALEGMTLPGKLADCQSKNASESELFIVEGDSAGGTAKTGRDRRTQAILPLRGKILNIERARLDKMLASEQITNLVVALGTAIGDTFDIAKLRYHKIIIATDADVDGAHIRTLLLTLFYRHFKPLIDGGFIYIAQPPLYKLKYGKDFHYFYSEQEKEDFLKNEKIQITEVSEEGGEEAMEEAPEEEEKEIKGGKEKDKKVNKKVTIQRYKGLGEMNAEELGETTMDINNRVLKQITVEDAIEADKVVDILMGNDVPSRKAFIQSNAKLARLDI